MEEARCAACGKAFSKGSAVIRIETGNLRGKQQLVNAKRWGLLHRPCFSRSIESPKAAMEEIRRLAKVSA